MKPFKDLKCRKPKAIPLDQLFKQWRESARKDNDIDEVPQETEGSTENETV